MLTAKQQQLLLFIHGRLTNDGISPSFDEMKDALGLKSKSGIHRLINALEERGFIKRLTNRARALEVVKLPDSLRPAVSLSGGETRAESNADNVIAGRFGSEPTAVPKAPNVASSEAASLGSVDIPLHGKIAAGTPIEALENIDSYIPVPPSMLGRGDCYALQVSGDSMIDLGILDGDTVVIESCQSAWDGEIIVALVDDQEATLKTLRRQDKHVALIPANRDHDTQIMEAGRVKVQGRLVGLLRSYH